MSKDKEIINKLFKVVAQQQQIITKLAQAQSVDGTGGDAGVERQRAFSVQADVIDALYGKGAKMVPGKVYPQVHYAKLDKGNLLVGLTVPANIRDKWDGVKMSLAKLLAMKYNATNVVWRDG